jgi:hypothetical protein
MYEADVRLEVGGSDLSDYALFPECSFTSSIKTQVGQFSITIVGTGEADFLGQEVRLSIDGEYYFGGVVTRQIQSFVFPASGPQKVILEGADWAIYFDRLVAWNKEKPTLAMKKFESGDEEGYIVRYFMNHYFELPDGFDGTSRVTSPVPVDTGDQVWVPLGAGETLRALLTVLSRVTQSVWYMDPWFRLNVHERYIDNSNYSLSDSVGTTEGGNVIGFRTVSAIEDISPMANDALVWGVEQMPRIMSHIRNDASIAKYGRWQYGEYSQQMYKSESVTAAAKTVVNRLSKPLTFFTARAFRPGIYPGEVVGVSAKGSAEQYVAKQVTIGFITKQQPYFDLNLGILPEDPWQAYDVVPYLTRPLEKMKVGAFSTSYDIGSLDQPYMPVVETWSRRQGGPVRTLELFGAGRIEKVEEYHWEPGTEFMVWDQMRFMTAGCGYTFVGALSGGYHYGTCICGGGIGPTDSWYGLQCCGEAQVDPTDPKVVIIDPALGPVHDNAPYSRIPRDYPVGTVFSSGGGLVGNKLTCIYRDMTYSCFCCSYSHIYAVWTDERVIAMYSPLMLNRYTGPTQIQSGTPGSARIRARFSAAAPGKAYSGFPIDNDGWMDWNHGIAPVNVVEPQFSPLHFVVMHVEGPSGSLTMPYAFQNGYYNTYQADSLGRSQYLNWVWNTGDVVADFDVSLPGWDRNGPPEQRVFEQTAEIEYPDPTKDHAWIIYCTNRRIDKYGGQYGPTSWGYMGPTNLGFPWDGIYATMHRGYEIQIAVCLDWMYSGISFPPVVAANVELLIETNPTGNLFEEDYPVTYGYNSQYHEYMYTANPDWDGIVDKGWGTEDIIIDYGDNGYATGWFRTTWPFQNDTLEIYEGGLLIDKSHYVIDDPQAPSPWPIRYKVDYPIVVDQSWVRYLSRPLQLNSHQAGDASHMG